MRERVIALLRLELRRQLPLTLRMAVAASVMLALFYLSGKRGVGDYVGALFGAGLGLAMLVPIGVMRDRMEGALEFLCALPIEPRAIALSRMIAAAVIVVPCAVVIGGFVAALPPNTTPNPAAVSGLSWLAFTLLGVCMTAAIARYDLAQLIGGPMIALMAAFFLAPRIVHAVAPGISGEAFVRFLQRPYGPSVVGGTLIVAITCLGLIALAIAENAFANYSHDSSVP